jgi:hypothetical protein
MGNQLASNPLELDTAAADVLLNFHVKIGVVQWYGYTDASHTAVLTDKNGNNIVVFKGVTDLPYQTEYIGGWYNGLICSTLGSGKLLVHLE